MHDAKPVNKTKGVTFLIFFLLIMILGVSLSINHLSAIITTVGGQVMQTIRGESTVSEFPATFEPFYNSLYSSQPWSLDMFSFVQSALGKHETRNFEVLKSNNGVLYLHGNESAIDTDHLKTIADEYEILFDETNKYGGHFLYVCAPFKNVGQAADLDDYCSDTTIESEKYLNELLQAKGIPVLDLKNYGECVQYYITDHHWTVESAFHASAIIMEELERVYGIEITGHEYYGNIENYTPKTYQDSFLGSIGIKVGPYFGGMDDFTIYNPKFETKLNFTHHVGEQQASYAGTFWETFIDQELLEDSTYYNKYDANMHGAYVESIINNAMAQNDYKGLLISHSYGRPMTQYMSLNFQELRYLDPQPGRYNESLVSYIRDYQPGIVVVMYNGTVNVSDGNGETQ